MVETTISRRSVLGAGLALGSTPVRAESLAGPDYMGRMILTVTVNESGPLRFALDSAASLSLIASDLIGPLGLIPSAPIGMHTLLAREEAATVVAQRVVSGALDAQDVRMAVGERAALGGLDGLISPTLLDRRRVTMNFRSDRISVGRTRARGRSDFSPEHRINFTSPDNPAFDSLVVIQVSIAGRRVAGVIDTGAQSSIVNNVLASRVGLRAHALADGSRTQPVLSATGRSAPAQMVILPGLSLGPVSFDRAPVLAGDFHAFDVWGYGSAPAMLLGMDILGRLRQIIIDYGSRDIVLDV